MAVIKKQKIRSVGETVGELEPLGTVGRNVRPYSHLEKSMDIPQKIKKERPHDPSISFLGIYLKKVKPGS